MCMSLTINLMRDVENLANMDSTSRNARNSVTGLIKQMKKSPQGKRMSEVKMKMDLLVMI